MDRLPRSGTLSFVKKYTCKEIKGATKGFSTILESGPDARVYKARFPDGLVAAVKRVESTGKGKDTFYREVQLLGRLNHRHVVRLKGFSEGDNRFLVFEHVENGSLKECLHDPLRTPLNWRTRLQIAIDVAAALEYLYYFCDPPVSHVSINSSNVMLDADYVAKLADVSFLKSDLNSDAEPSENIAERRSNLVFQYGLLILELVAGQSMSGGDELVKWVQGSGFAGSMHKMVDADLGNSYDSKELRCLLIVARLCTKRGNRSSIAIPQIVRYLQGRLESPRLHM